jgi:tetratricopeptide (TPR) repeat protein
MRLTLALLLSLPFLARAQSVSTDQRIANYEKIAATQPKDLRLKIQLAFLYLQKVRETTDYSYLERTIKLDDEVLDQDSGNFEALRLRNEIAMMRHEFRQVAESAHDLTKLAPSDAGNWGNLGDALMELGEYERAEQAYKRMLAARPSLESYNRAAYYSFVTGDPANAIALMKLAIEAGSKVPESVAWCQSELGDMYFKTGKIAEARAAYEAAIQLFPSLHRAHAGLGRLDAIDGNIAAAIQSYKRAQTAVPLVEYSAALEQLYLAQGKPEEAKRQRGLIDVVDKLGRARGETANRVLALIYIEEDRKVPEAVQLAESEQQNRGDVYTYDALAWVYHKQKRPVEAQKMAEKALKFNTPEPVFYYHAGAIAADAGNKVEAKRLLLKALALNSRFDFRLGPEASRLLKALSD